MPCHHRPLQRAVIGQLASAIVQRRGLLGIDVDFIIVAHRRAQSSYACRFTASTAGFSPKRQHTCRPRDTTAPSIFAHQLRQLGDVGGDAPRFATLTVIRSPGIHRMPWRFRLERRKMAGDKPSTIGHEDCMTIRVAVIRALLAVAFAICTTPLAVSGDFFADGLRWKLLKQRSSRPRRVSPPGRCPVGFIRKGATSRLRGLRCGSILR